MLVRNVVGELEFVEGHDLGHPLLARARTVRVYVHPFGHFRIRLAGDHPSGVMELVSTVVHGHYVHEEDVLGPFVQTRHFHLVRREHASVRKGRSQGYELMKSTLPFIWFIDKLFSIIKKLLK